MESPYECGIESPGSLSHGVRVKNLKNTFVNICEVVISDMGNVRNNL